MSRASTSFDSLGEPNWEGYMGCLLVLLSAIAPRIVFLIVWVARPNKVDAAFETWILPLLGIIFVPFATLVYVILWTAGGLSSTDWLWVGLAVLIDLTHWGSGYSQRRQVRA